MSVRRTHSGACTQGVGLHQNASERTPTRVYAGTRVAHAIVTRTRTQVQQHSHSKQQQNKSKKSSSQFHAYNEAEHHTILF